MENNTTNCGTILVCIDTTNASEEALKYACHKVKNENLKLQILAVIEGSHQNLLFGAKAISSQKRTQMEKYLNKLIDSVCKNYNIIPAVSVREGDIVVEIIREIKNASDCKMVIFGKSKNSQSDNTVLPKIVGKMGEKIHVPLLIVPQGLKNKS